MNNPLDAGIFPPATSEDHALVVAANRGNANVFETLFERYQPKIFAIALRFTRVREDAEDIVQQTFQKACCRRIANKDFLVPSLITVRVRLQNVGQEGNSNQAVRMSVARTLSGNTVFLL